MMHVLVVLSIPPAVQCTIAILGMSDEGSCPGSEGPQAIPKCHHRESNVPCFSNVLLSPSTTRTETILLVGGVN